MKVNVSEAVKGAERELELRPSLPELKALRERVEALLEAIDVAIETAVATGNDDRIERAILYLAGRCDGSIARDGQGFNGCDARFGRWLADRVEEGALKESWARKALDMLRKYEKSQLAPRGLTLPEWEDVAGQYDRPLPRREVRGGKPERRLELYSGGVAYIAPYDPEALRVVKAIEPRGRWTPEAAEEIGAKAWVFPMEALPALLEAFPDYAADEQIEAEMELQRIEAERAKAEKEEAALKAAEELADMAESIDSHLPEKVRLYAHQRPGVEFLLSHRKGFPYKGAILADDMGLGKTLQALVAAKVLATEKGLKIFVVCPAGLKDVWRREAALVEVGIEIYSWAKQPKAPEEGFVLILDEAHYAQNIKARRTQNAIALAGAETCEAAWLLTGTPAKSGRPSNLFPLLKAVGHPLAKNRREYESRYCAAHYKNVGRRQIWDTTGAAFLAELNEKIRDVLLQRKKADVLDLPEKVRLYKPASLSGKEARAYEAEVASKVEDYRRRVEESRALLEAGEIKPEDAVNEGAEALVTLNALRKVGSDYKIPATLEVAEEVLEQGGQVVIFTEFVPSAKSIADALSGWGVELLTGETPQKERPEQERRFQSGESKSKVFVRTISAGATGSTLTAAQNVVLHDRAWSPGDNDQAEDRIHRIGQVGTAFATWVQLNPIDGLIDGLGEEKRHRIAQMLDGSDGNSLPPASSLREMALEIMKRL